MLRSEPLGWLCGLYVFVDRAQLGASHMPSQMGRTVSNVKRFRGGLVSKAHRLLYQSTLSSRVMKKKKSQFSPGKIKRRTVFQKKVRTVFERALTRQKAWKTCLHDQDTLTNSYLFLTSVHPQEICTKFIGTLMWPRVLQKFWRGRRAFI